MIFNFNRWLSRELDDGDMVRELPVASPGKPPLNSELNSIMILFFSFKLELP